MNVLAGAVDPVQVGIPAYLPITVKVAIGLEHDDYETFNEWLQASSLDVLQLYETCSVPCEGL